MHAHVRAHVRLCMHTGTHRDAPGHTGTHRDAPGRAGANGGAAAAAAAAAAGHLVTASPSHTEITSRTHTASRRDHVTDTEHDFPVRGDGQAGLTPPTSNHIV